MASAGSFTCFNKEWVLHCSNHTSMMHKQPSPHFLSGKVPEGVHGTPLPVPAANCLVGVP